MILTNEEMQEIREAIEQQAGLDEELLHRCGPLIHMGKFDEAVRSAFVLLEERLRNATNKEGMTGTNLANYSFDPNNGALIKFLPHNKSEREGLHFLFAGAFKLFRNPTAHGAIGYDPTKGKAIISFINLLLLLLDEIGEMPPVEHLSENTERVVKEVESRVSPAAANRLRLFLSKCRKLGLEPRLGTKWVPFRRFARIKYPDWPEPRPHRLTLFYIYADDKNVGFYIPLNQYYVNVIGLDTDKINKQFRQIGFTPKGKLQELLADLTLHHSTTFFDALYQLVEEIAGQLEATL